MSQMDLFEEPRREVVLTGEFAVVGWTFRDPEELLTYRHFDSEEEAVEYAQWVWQDAPGLLGMAVRVRDTGELKHKKQRLAAERFE